MSTSLELRKQAQQLLMQAEEARQKEVAQAVAEIRQIMSEYGLTAEDIGMSPRTAKRSTTKGVIKFRSPNGDTWTGRGRKPTWIAEAIKTGKSLDQFAV